MQNLIQDPVIPDTAKIRLVLLYGLRYEKSPQNSITKLFDLLYQAGLKEAQINVCNEKHEILKLTLIAHWYDVAILRLRTPTRRHFLQRKHSFQKQNVDAWSSRRRKCLHATCP